MAGARHQLPHQHHKGVHHIPPFGVHDLGVVNIQPLVTEDGRNSSKQAGHVAAIDEELWCHPAPHAGRIGPEARSCHGTEFSGAGRLLFTEKWKRYFWTDDRNDQRSWPIILRYFIPKNIKSHGIRKMGTMSANIRLDTDINLLETIESHLAQAIAKGEVEVENWCNQRRSTPSRCGLWKTKSNRWVRPNKRWEKGTATRKSKWCWPIWNTTAEKHALTKTIRGNQSNYAQRIPRICFCRNK